MHRRLKYLSKQHIYMIHQATIEEFGGHPGSHEDTDGKIESILAQQHPHFGFDKYPGPLMKAAMLWYFFTKDHCFVDGNKRVGMQSAIVFFTINGFDDHLDDDDGYAKTMEIAQSGIPEANRDDYIKQLSQWLGERFKPEKEILRFRRR